LKIEKIERYLEEDSIFFIDIEGSEFNLLNIVILSKLSNNVIVIEIYNWIDNFEDKYIKLLRDANEFFTIEIIESLNRPIHSRKELDHFHEDNKFLLLSEGRPNRMRHLKLSPRI